jgi:hypothetical protein
LKEVRAAGLLQDFDLFTPGGGVDACRTACFRRSGALLYQMGKTPVVENAMATPSGLRWAAHHRAGFKGLTADLGAPFDRLNKISKEEQTPQAAPGGPPPRLRRPIDGAG